MVEQQPSKLMTRVRFPSPAPTFGAFGASVGRPASTAKVARRSPKGEAGRRLRRHENTLKPGFSVLAKAQCIMHDITAAGPYMVRRSRFPEECSSMARAPVSKTGGWGFESLHSCQQTSEYSQI